MITGAGGLNVSSGPVVGDYNNDGKVDSSDYVVWRLRSGATTLTNRDPNNTGAVGQADFISWRTHFGQTAVSGSGSGSNLNLGGDAAVPEPPAIGLFVLATLTLISSRRRTVRL